MKKPFDIKAFTVATLRRASYRLPARQEALKRARIRRGWYKCELCGSEVQKKNMALDHIIPIVPVTGWDSWDKFIERLFCSVDGFQVICKKPCHSEKTKAENKLRRENKKKMIDNT